MKNVELRITNYELEIEKTANWISPLPIQNSTFVIQKFRKNAMEIEANFKEVFDALDLKEQRKAMRGAMRKTAKALKAIAQEEIAASKLGRGTRQAVSKSLRTRVYPSRYGLGFMITTKPHGKEGYHTNRAGKEKPVLMWAQSGTKQRITRGTRKKPPHSTGKEKAYRFLEKAEQRGTRMVEEDLFGEFQENCNNALRKKKLI